MLHFCFTVAIDELSVEISSSSSHNARKICLEFVSSCYQTNLAEFYAKITIQDDFGCITYTNYSMTESSCIPYVSFPVNENCAESFHLVIEVYNTTAFSQPLLTVPGDLVTVTMLCIIILSQQFHHHYTKLNRLHQ